MQGIYPKMEVWQDGGLKLPYLPNFKLESRIGLLQFDALLHPYRHGGYDTRLFLSVQPALPLNWSVHQLCGRTWHTWSWNGVPASLPWMQILANHLRAFS